MKKQCIKHIVRFDIALGLLAYAQAISLHAMPLESKTPESSIKPTHLDSTTTFNTATAPISTTPTTTEQPRTEQPRLLSPVYATKRTYAHSHTALWGKDALLYSGDIAKSLLYIPGFSMARKGGLGQEIYLRSQTAGRLPILIDGSNLHGACGGRMDTSITYIFPENYHRISIVKGPQDVRFSAMPVGGVLFEREIQRATENSLEADTSVLAGSFSRLDLHASAKAKATYGSLQAIASHYSQDHYTTGSANFTGGSATHSAYKRESASVIATLTPTKSTGIEASFDIGRGFSAYQDRMMDARTFDRLSFSLKLQQDLSSTKVPRLNAQAWFHQIDHIMDNFTHRTPATKYSLSNPKRVNTGARAELMLMPSEQMELYIGANYSYDEHSLRSIKDQASTQATNAILQQAYKPNFTFSTFGAFLQGAYYTAHSGDVFFGARYDYVQTDKVADKATAQTTQATQNHLQNHLGSTFVRYEARGDMFSWYAGLGVVQRSPDFWERSKTNGLFLLPETNAQLDISALVETKRLFIQASAYSSYVWDYILLHYGKDSTRAFNTNALVMGAELEARYTIAHILHILGSLSYVYGQNLTTKALDSTTALQASSPLPQIAPLQAQFSVYLKHRSYLARADVFTHLAQTRYAMDYGNVVGKDFGRSSGFATLSLYGGYVSKRISLLCGIENLTNALYSYHLSKSGVSVGDLAPVARIYEPGRSFWAKLTLVL